MQISAETWQKDAFEIIDYDCNNLIFSNIETNDQGYIYRQRESIFYSKVTQKKDDEKLFEIVIDEKKNFELKLNNYEFDAKSFIKTRNSSWFAFIRSRMDDNVDMNRYELKEGDIIRIGRLYLRVKILKFSNNEKDEKNINLMEINKININNTNKYRNSFTSPINNISIPTPNTRISIGTNNNNLSINTALNRQEIQVNSPIPEQNSRFKFLKLKSSNSYKNITIENKKGNFCRICYSEEDNNENPLIKPCTCHGSLKYIHLNCLRQWLKTNSYVLCEDKEFSKSFKYKEPLCELCKTKFPDFIRHKEKLYEITGFEIYYKNYILFECLTEDKHNNKYLYMLSLDNIDNNHLYNIGRGHDSTLVLHDASISRNHCVLRIVNKKIFLEDCFSKFGTLALIQSETIKLAENLKLFMQIGRSFIKCNVKKSFSLFGCCTISESKNFDFYYKQNIINIEDKPKKTVKIDDNYEINEIEEDNKKIIDMSEDNDYNNKNNIKSNEEDYLIANEEVFNSPMKLNPISENMEENKNEGNNSIHIDNE